MQQDGQQPAATSAEESSDGRRFSRIGFANHFMEELLESVETLTGIAEQHGARTLADLFYLHSAILNDSFIDSLPNESKVLDIVQGLPSARLWRNYIIAA